ncbi:hypothetical protein BUZ15_04860 [Staphylococcus gallinarum]|uniref:Lipoprotein n=1 Tax=Staphylococcus gallinarum TaxID=1293 RepID=A0A2T4T004_STAGA|nr:hypothetical protein [Staphylococcus gallinarum]MBU7217838.1 hypothetical protein [Staphylococcus gallinarum]MCD8821174.1 hypothetical protein [Staphylococcus gallinarum]PTL11119.1 hypothetical protein BUZ15_04860 [Staphylococcus gallinarum]RIL31039.1 hypothetical protein BUY98_11965 [Staphylococcus gallinarum]RIL44387.1 hypothetical protein BUZ01_00010 [Staphylococcus gallinarum]
MKIFFGTIFTLIFIGLACFAGYFAYDLYFNNHTQSDSQSSKDVQQSQEESYQNNNDNVAQSTENIDDNESAQQNGVVNNGKPGRVNNLHDTQKAYALMSVPRQDLPDDQKVIYDGVISTAMQNINNGVGNAEDYKIKEIYDGIQSVQPK